MAGMASPSRVVRSLTVALLVAATAVVAACSADAAAGITTTAIVRFPSGFHAARPNDEATLARAVASALPSANEVATLRLEGEHRRAVAATDAETVAPTTVGFVCQIDMGMAQQD
jgi:hypothetical protein